MLLRTFPAALYQHWEAMQPMQACMLKQQLLPLEHKVETYTFSL